MRKLYISLLNRLFIRVAFLALLLAFSPLLFQSFAYAQISPAKSNCLVTQVGTPDGSIQLPPGCTFAGGPEVTGPCGSVVAQDAKIMAVLEFGPRGSFSKLTTRVGNPPCTSYETPYRIGVDPGTVYWCTNSVIDSYKLAGLSDMYGSQFVVEMHAWWMGPDAAEKKYKYVEYELAGSKIDALAQVKPGYAMLLESVRLSHNGSEHVALVKEIKIDPAGNGYIKTYESNGSVKTPTYTVVNGVIHTGYYPVRAFGGH